MRHHFRSFSVTAGALILAGSALYAQGPGPLQERLTTPRIDVPAISERIKIEPLEEGPGTFSAAPKPTRSRILGIVIDELGVIVPSAGLVLIRSLRDGTVFGRAPVDDVGQFSLADVEPGLYAAELVDDGGTLLTSTTPSFSVGVGQVVQLTTVVSQHSFGGFAALLGRSTAGAVNSAVTAGILALETPAPISP